MQLHKLLRLILDNTMIILFDTKGNQLAAVRTKSDLNLDFYEDWVLEITTGKVNKDLSCLFITVER